MKSSQSEVAVAQASGQERSARPITGIVTACLIADGGDFCSRSVASLTLDFAGVVGDHHAGLTRRSTSREPWHPRGTELRNDRQLSLVSAEELAEVATLMDLPEIAAGWIGANLVVTGVAAFSQLPPGTKMLFPSGATISVEAENGPCRVAGKSIGDHFPTRDGIDLLFPKLARHRRGIVASVERPGMIHAGDTFMLRVPAQHPWPAQP